MPVFKHPLRGPAHLVSRGPPHLPTWESCSRGGEGVKIRLDGQDLHPRAGSPTDTRIGSGTRRSPSSNDLPGRAALRAHPERRRKPKTLQPLQGRALTAHRNHRPERRRLHQRDHAPSRSPAAAVCALQGRQPTKAQLLAKALKACKKDKKKSTAGAACERPRATKYGSKAKKAPKKGAKKFLQEVGRREAGGADAAVAPHERDR